VTSLVHRILSIQAEEIDFDNEAEVFHEGCRLGAWFFLAEIRHRYYIRRIGYPVQIAKLKALLQRHGGEWVGLEMLHLWVLVMAVLQSKEWFTGEIRRLADRLGLRSSFDVEVKLRDILWIDDVHGSKLHSLQEEIWP